MRKLHWFNALIFAACLMGQLFGYQAFTKPVSEDSPCCLTELSDSTSLSECIISEVPLTFQASKARAVLACNRLAHRRMVVAFSEQASATIYPHTDRVILSLQSERSTDNRGPPLA